MFIRQTKAFAVSICIALFSLTVTNHALAVIYTVSGGNLVAASDISADLNSDGIFERYRVSFLDGRHNAIQPFFPSWQDSFGDAQRLTFALDAQVLRDNVNVGGVIYNFDSTPSLLNGCSISTTICDVRTIYSRNANVDSAYIVRNTTNIINDPKSGPQLFSSFQNTSGLPGATIARWSPYIAPTSPVPEPSSYAMFLVGLGLISLFKHKKQ